MNGGFWFMLRLEEIVAEPVLVLRISGFQSGRQLQAFAVKSSGKTISDERASDHSDVDRRNHQACAEEDDFPGGSVKGNLDAISFTRVRIALCCPTLRSAGGGFGSNFLRVLSASSW